MSDTTEDELIKYFALKDKSKALKKQRREIAHAMEADSKRRDCDYATGRCDLLDIELEDYCEWCLAMEAPSKELHKNSIKQRAILLRLRSIAKKALTEPTNKEIQALITQAKKDLLAEVREKSENLSEVESTTPNTYNFRPIEAVPLAAIKEIEEGL